MVWDKIASIAAPIVGGALGAKAGSDAGQRGMRPEDYIPGHLREDWKMLGSQIAQLPTPQYYPGQLTYGINPTMQNALQRMNQWQSGRGGTLANRSQWGGMMGLGAQRMGQNYLNDMRRRGPNQFQYDQGTYDQIMANLAPGMQAAFDANMRDPMRQFNEQTIPGINMNAVGAGQGFGSTRAFNQGAIAARGLQDRAADVASGIWQNAANQANRGAMTGGTLNLGSANQGDQNILRGYGQFAGLGPRYQGQAHDMGLRNIGLGYDAGDWRQNYQQGAIDRRINRWNFNQQAPWDALANQLNMIETGQATPNTPGNPFGGAIQGAQLGHGIYQAGKDAGWWNADPLSTDPGNGIGFGGWTGQDPGGYWT